MGGRQAGRRVGRQAGRQPKGENKTKRAGEKKRIAHLDVGILQDESSVPACRDKVGFNHHGMLLGYLTIADQARFVVSSQYVVKFVFYNL